MKVGLCNLGCKVNTYEMEYIASLFKERGYEICDFNDFCDVYVVNTCTVTNNSDVKSRKMINHPKKINKNSCLVVCGCFIESAKDYKNDDIDIVLDLIDNYIDGFHNSYEWGYSIPYFLAGSHSAHVNNISYLSAKAGIASRDINFLLNRLDPVERKRYDYSLLEKTYLDYQNTHCEDDSAIASLQNALSGKDILVLLPGHTIKTCQGQIQHFYKEKNPIVISVNLLTDCYPIDFAYFSNKNRYQYWRNEAAFNKCKKIVTSNVTTRKDDNLFIIDFLRLVKCGWEQLDNSGVLLLRLLDLMNVNSISIAGFDGYSHNSENPNYVEKAMEKTRNTLNAEEANKDIKSMLVDYKNTRKSSCPISFITPSYFETVMDE